MPLNRSAAELVLGLLVACGGGAEESDAGVAMHGASGASSAGNGGNAGAAMPAGAGGTPASTAGGGHAATGDVTCDRGCEHAVVCLTGGTLCPALTAQDADSVAAACHEICAQSSSEFEALSERADACGLALSVLVDNADLASRPDRDVIERCAPPEACNGVCDTVALCATDECENRGADGTQIFAACIEQCSADQSWIDAVVEAHATTDCRAALQAYAAVQPGTLPVACTGRD